MYTKYLVMNIFFAITVTQRTTNNYIAVPSFSFIFPSTARRNI